MRRNPRGRLSRVKLGVILGLLGLIGAGFAWWSRDPWPPLVVISYPDRQEIMLAPRFSLDGRSFVLSQATGVVAWDVATGQPRQPPPPGPIVLAPIMGNNRSPVPSHDHRSYAGIVEPSPMNQDVVWADRESGAIRGRFAVGSGRVEHLAFSVDDRSIRTLVVDPNKQATIVDWDLASGSATRRPLVSWSENEMDFASTISPDGRLLASVESVQRHIRLWDLDADRPRVSWLGPMMTLLRHNYINPVFTADSRLLYQIRSNRRVECWDVATARLVRTLDLPTAGQRLISMTISPDGRVLAIGTHVAPARSFLTAVWNQLFHLLPGWIGVRRGELLLLDTTTGEVLARTRDAYEAAFAPDGRTVATFAFDETIALRAVPRPRPPGQ